MSNKIIIGIVGENASGKTTATEYLKNKYGAVCFRFSDMLGDILARLYLAPTRANFQKLSTVLRQNFSEDIMSQIIAEDVKNPTLSLLLPRACAGPPMLATSKTRPDFI